MPAAIAQFSVVTASITDPIVNFAVDVVDQIGVAGVFILMTLESMCVPIPSEPTMMAAGFAVSRGDMELIPVVAAGVAANVVGSWIAWAAGYYGRVDLIEKHGHKVFIKPHHLTVADRWFEKHGDATVFFTHMLPIVRTFISLPAGVAKMPFIRFSVLTFLGCLPWVFMLTFIGQQVGANWTDWKDSLHYFDYFVAACIVVGAVYLFVKWRRGGGGDADIGPTDPGRSGPAEPAADAGTR